MIPKLPILLVLISVVTWASSLKAASELSYYVVIPKLAQGDQKQGPILAATFLKLPHLSREDQIEKLIAFRFFRVNFLNPDRQRDRDWSHHLSNFQDLKNELLKFHPDLPPIIALYLHQLTQLHNEAGDSILHPLFHLAQDAGWQQVPILDVVTTKSLKLQEREPELMRQLFAMKLVNAEDEGRDLAFPDLFKKAFES